MAMRGYARLCAAMRGFDRYFEIEIQVEVEVEKLHPVFLP